MKISPHGFTVWLTGLPSAGKSTLAQLVADEVERRGIAVELLDADVIRTRFSKGLGFSKEDRDENIRRLGFLCHLLSKHGVSAVAAAISPYRAVRNEIRASLPHFVEVHVNASLETCMARDVKGLYKKALAGEIPKFTGLDDPYEPPEAPEVLVNTDQETPRASLHRILAKLERLKLIPRVSVESQGRNTRANQSPEAPRPPG
jgi:adenylyl-sulfate kinase